MAESLLDGGGRAQRHASEARAAAFGDMNRVLVFGFGFSRLVGEGGFVPGGPAMMMVFGFWFSNGLYGNCLKFFREFLALVCGINEKSFGVFLCYGLEPLFFVLVVLFVWVFCSFGCLVCLGVLFVGFVCLVVCFFRMEMEIRDLYEHE